MRTVEKDIMGSVGHEAAHHPTKIHRKEDGKVTEEEMAREHRTVASPKEEKVETNGKAKVNERKDNVSTTSQNLQKNSGQADPGNSGQINPGKLTPTVPTGEKMTGTQQSRVLKHQQQLKNFNGELRLSNFGFASHIESFKLDRLDPSQRTITFGIDTAACKTVVPAHHPARGYLIHKDSLLGCAYSITSRDKVCDQGKGILCTLHGSGKPVVTQSREVNCRRPLMAVTEMTDCGQRVCFGPQRQGFSFDPRTGQKIDFTPTPGGWDLTMTSEPPERANKVWNKAIQEISAKKRSQVEARDYGAITDAKRLVKIMGCDPFRRPGFSP